MILLESRQRFGAVGQGLFYWGALHLRDFGPPKDRFTYVFDCGTSSKATNLQKEISFFVPQVPPTSPISLLIVSHLDYDHVSGLDLLLQKTTAQTVVLPYLEPAERLLLLLRAPRADEWYRKFLLGPSEFLRKKRISKIVYVVRGKNEQSVPPPEGEESPVSKEPGFFLDISTMEDDAAARESARTTDAGETEQTAFKNDSWPLSIFPFWQFIFYISPKPEAQVQCLRQLLETTFPGIPLTDVFLDKKRTAILAKHYRNAFHTRDLNHTCLACLHGPLLTKRFPWYGPGDPGFGFPLGAFLWSPIGPPLYSPFLPRMLEEAFEYWMHEAQNRGLQNFLPDYTLLMGDLSANQEWGRLERRFRQYLQRIQTFQIPHHGARSSWTDSIPQSLLGALFIISAGIKNRFGHPHPEVLESLSKAGLAGNVRWVNELTPLTGYQIFPVRT